jgi:hypothetical protein
MLPSVFLYYYYYYYYYYICFGAVLFCTHIYAWYYSNRTETRTSTKIYPFDEIIINLGMILYIKGNALSNFRIQK